MSHCEDATQIEQRGASILVVDDDPDMRAAVCRILRQLGHHPSPEVDGYRAAKRLQEREFDVLVTVIQMPRIDGIRLLQSLRARGLDIPVVLMTGAPQIESAVDALRCGAVEYLMKPFTPDSLRAAVDKATAAHRCSASSAGDLNPAAALQQQFDEALASVWMAYQPIVRAADYTVFGYEALLRTTHDKLFGPGPLLAAADALDSFDRVGQVVRATVAANFTGASVSTPFFVNIHPSELLDDSLYQGAWLEHAESIVLEITERSSLDRIPDLKSRIARLKSLGLRIAIDDLGAGYSSLNFMTELAPEFVKLDMALIRDVDSNLVKEHIVRQLAGLCHQLGVQIVAEGVETPGERDTLAELGCDLLQGYQFARPARGFPEVAAQSDGSRRRGAKSSAPKSALRSMP